MDKAGLLFIVGLVLGAMIGVMIMCLIFVGRNSDEYH